MEKKPKENQAVQKQDGLESGVKGKSMAPPPFQLKSEAEPVQSNLSNSDLVVRGGLSEPSNLATNQKKDPRGHISSNSSPGAAIAALATSPVPFENGSITVSTVGQIRAIANDNGLPMDVMEDPTRNNPLHASIVPHHLEISQREATALSSAFTAQPNRWKQKK